MSDDDRVFLERLRATFRGEVADLVSAIDEGMAALVTAGSEADRRTTAEVLFRAAHSIKGAARAADAAPVERTAAALEESFAGLKRSGALPTAGEHEAIRRLVDALRQPGGPTDEPALPEAPSPSPAPPASARIGMSALEGLLHTVEELSGLSARHEGVAADIDELQMALTPTARAPRLRAAVRALRRHLAEESEPGVAAALTLLADHVDEHLGRLPDLQRRARNLGLRCRRDATWATSGLGSLRRDLQELLLMPAADTLAGFPRMVETAARDLGKQARLTITGDDAMLDRRVLQALRQPLTHLLRNAVDHGIERPEQRRRAGKDPTGTIGIGLERSGAGFVTLTVTDDGAGVDPDRVRAAAAKTTLADGVLDDPLELIFHSQVTTAPLVTDLSGRGLGLAIVRETIEDLGGQVSVESPPGQGTTFRLRVPSTAAAFRGVTVHAGRHRFVIPSTHVVRVMRVRADDSPTSENRPTVSLDGQPVAVASLAAIMAVQAPTPAPDQPRPCLVLASGPRRAALTVDAVTAEDEHLVRPLGPLLPSIPLVDGATLLADGTTALVLDPRDLMDAVLRTAPTPAPTAPAAGVTSRRPVVLVVEDTVTSRMLLRNLLSAAGYEVLTAVDGAEALATARERSVDLVVSDIEMPRMDGFELTTRLRADERLRDVPIVLVTARESREDRERGIEAGANAYLVKSSFEQSNLLAVVRRFL